MEGVHISMIECLFLLGYEVKVHVVLPTISFLVYLYLCYKKVDFLF